MLLFLIVIMEIYRKQRSAVEFSLKTKICKNITEDRRSREKNALCHMLLTTEQLEDLGAACYDLEICRNVPQFLSTSKTVTRDAFCHSGDLLMNLGTKARTEKNFDFKSRAKQYW